MSDKDIANTVILTVNNLAYKEAKVSLRSIFNLPPLIYHLS